MSNDFTGKVWTIDTAESIPKIGGDGTTYNGQRVKITRLEWIPNAVDNDLVVQDARGRSIWTVRSIFAGANNESAAIERREFPNGEWFDGIKFTTIDAGTLYVYFA